MSFIKKVVATFARFQQGHEAMPDQTAGTEQFRQETEREKNLAQERERAQRERMDEQAAREQVKVEVEEMPEQREVA